MAGPAQRSRDPPRQGWARFSRRHHSTTPPSLHDERYLERELTRNMSNSGRSTAKRSYPPARGLQSPVLPPPTTLRTHSKPTLACSTRRASQRTRLRHTLLSGESVHARLQARPAGELTITTAGSPHLPVRLSRSSPTFRIMRLFGPKCSTPRVPTLLSAHLEIRASPSGCRRPKR